VLQRFFSFTLDQLNTTSLTSAIRVRERIRKHRHLCRKIEESAQILRESTEFRKDAAEILAAFKLFSRIGHVLHQVRDQDSVNSCMFVYKLELNKVCHP
jgi:hypothetical protein